MTVKQLIKLLSQYNLNAEVRLHDTREPGLTMPASEVDEMIDGSRHIFGFGSVLNEGPQGGKKAKRVIIL